MKIKTILAAAALGSLALPAFAQTQITVGQQALLAGWDFDNILGSNLPSSPVRARYSDVYGNNSSSSALTGPGGIYFNGSFGSDNWGTVAKTATGDIDRDILTRTGTGSTFDLGGQTGGEGATNFNNASVGTAGMNEFSIWVHSSNSQNTFGSITLTLYGRDIANLGGGTIAWSYSTDAGVTKTSTGLSSSFTTNAFALSTINFSSVTAMNAVADLYIIGTITEAASGVTLSLDNIAVYGTALTAVPEPSTYAAIAGALALAGAAYSRRRRAVQA